jgi:hypothetical protein
LVEDFTYPDLYDTKNIKDESSRLLSVEKVFFKPLGNIRVYRTRFLVQAEKTEKTSTAIERLEKPWYGITLQGLGLRDLVSANPYLSDILDTLHRAGLVYLVKTEDEIRYASVRDDLKLLVYSLSELTNFKWTFIQVPEMEYFRRRTPDETENTRRILGDRAGDYVKKEDEEREKIQKDYKEWNKQSTHYFEKPVVVEDENKNVLVQMTHKEFLEEEQLNFENWKKNLRIQHLENNGKVNTHTISFFVDKCMNQEWLDKFVRKCRAVWKGKPKHFLDLEKESIRKHNKAYQASVKKAKEEFALSIEKYRYLLPVLRLINQDFFA